MMTVQAAMQGEPVSSQAALQAAQAEALAAASALRGSMPLQVASAAV